MTIPLNFKDYYNKVSDLNPRGHISSREQIASPKSAGSRGLQKLDMFTNSPNQLMKGNTSEPTVGGNNIPVNTYKK